MQKTNLGSIRIILGNQNGGHELNIGISWKSTTQLYVYNLLNATLFKTNSQCIPRMEHVWNGESPQIMNQNVGTLPKSFQY